MILQSLNILNYRNIREASLEFSPKLNCFVGLNGQGKTNVLDAIYLLSFAKSAFTAQDSLNITHGEEMAFVQGNYRPTPNPSLKGGAFYTNALIFSSFVPGTRSIGRSSIIVLAPYSPC